MLRGVGCRAQHMSCDKDNMFLRRRTGLSKFCEALSNHVVHHKNQKMLY